jgi:D-arabinose 1-dehydrogenase-like Zn-dependent alcohol dehydrogenase
MIARHEAVALMPDGMDPADAGPLLCAGITTFKALQHSRTVPGELVAVHGIGGLGHLVIQFAAKLGYRVVGVGRGPENATLAKKLRADAYILLSCLSSPNLNPRCHPDRRAFCGAKDLN